MAEITVSMVKDLRDRTDAPMMDCKKALTEANGDSARAEEILNKCPMVGLLSPKIEAYLHNGNIQY